MARQQDERHLTVRLRSGGILTGAVIWADEDATLLSSLTESSLVHLAAVEAEPQMTGQLRLQVRG